MRLFGSSDVEANLTRAETRFREGVKIYEELREDGVPHPAAQGFQYEWLAKTYILRGDFTAAEGALSEMKVLFGEELARNPGSGAMAYYNETFGRLELAKGNPQEAGYYFEEAKRINTEVVDYPNGRSRAIFGLALVEYELGNKEKAESLKAEAYGINPDLGHRGFI